MKTKKLVVVLGLATLKDIDLVLRARHIASLIKGNKKFPEADFRDRVNSVMTLSDAMDHVLQLPWCVSKADEVKGARVALDMALTALGSEVQLMVNNLDLTIEDRLGLVHEAGMKVRQNKGRTLRVFAVKHGRMKGSVICYAARKDSVSHEWQVAADISRLDNRTALPATSKSMTEITGLIPGHEYAFYHRPVRAGKVSAWEGPLFLMVI